MLSKFSLRFLANCRARFRETSMLLLVSASRSSRANHSKVRFASDDRKAGVIPIPINYNTGAYTVTRENVELFLKKA